ncbi:MAG: glycosyltransferase family 1 protein [Anaerolineae bacterium]|nr:MAG: glycosyltransferase family 1 protein [Anaerolineae bacterium]
MNLLIALTYYRPHYSGLTIYVERMARALARRGHNVTVLTSRFDPALPAEEMRDGVRVVRPWVLMRISKGVIMPGMLPQAARLMRQADLVNVHVPQLDAAPIALLGRALGKPVVMTYHCDLRLPRGPIHFLANQASHIANHITARAATSIVTNTRDYAENSPFLRRYLDKIAVIPPSVEVAPVDEAALQAFRRKYGLQPGQPVIGMLARLATEKGVEYLVQAMPRVLARFPNARVLYVGQHENVLGEEAYARKLAPLIAALGEHWTFLGVLPDEEVAAFFHACDVTVLPSLNSTESFGMVQVESMTCGTPVVASDLPGVRQPVAMTGMGRTVPPADAEALAEALIEVLNHPEAYRGDPAQVRLRFSPDTIAAEYETLFERLLQLTPNPVSPRSPRPSP